MRGAGRGKGLKLGWGKANTYGDGGILGTKSLKRRLVWSISGDGAKKKNGTEKKKKDLRDREERAREGSEASACMYVCIFLQHEGQKTIPAMGVTIGPTKA